MALVRFSGMGSKQGRLLAILNSPTLYSIRIAAPTEQETGIQTSIAAAGTLTDKLENLPYGDSPRKRPLHLAQHLGLQDVVAAENHPT